MMKLNFSLFSAENAASHTRSAGRHEGVRGREQDEASAGTARATVRPDADIRYA
jgi:hypothetical protein